MHLFGFAYMKVSCALDLLTTRHQSRHLHLDVLTNALNCIAINFTSGIYPESYLYRLHLFEQEQLAHLIFLTSLNCSVTPLEFADDDIRMSVCVL